MRGEWLNVEGFDLGEELPSLYEVPIPITRHGFDLGLSALMFGIPFICGYWVAKDHGRKPAWVG